MLPRVKSYKLIDTKYFVGLRAIELVDKEKKRFEEAAKRAGSGIFVETPDSFPLNSFVEVDLLMPGKADMYSVRGIVRLQNPNPSTKRPKGLGIHLLEVSSKEKQRKYHLPDAAMLSELLSGLFGKDCKITEEDEKPIPPKDTIIAVYVDQNEQIGALWLCDFGMVVRGGAALSMIPPSGLATTIAEGKLEDNLAENFKEVLNVASSSFNTPDSPHLKLKEMIIRPEAFPPDVEKVISTMGGRHDFKVDISEYGAGKVTIVCE